MAFIQLTFLGTNEDTAIRSLYTYKNQWDECEKIFINTDYIILMKPDDCYTQLKLKNSNIWVKEKIEEILNMLNVENKDTQHISDETLREMMKDPKYWRDQEPEYVKKVENGFKKLYGGK